MLTRWILYFIPAIAIEVFCYLTNPIACLFVVKRERTDVVKRMGKQVVTMPREYLIPIFYLWQTHDNAVDEGWYGAYEDVYIWYLWWVDTSKWTQTDYDNSRFKRWFYRVWWLNRNLAYGWLYKYFSVPVEPLKKDIELGQEYYTPWLRLRLFDKSFQCECHLPIGFNRFMSLNFGWKEHKGFPRKLYANRVIGAIRKFRQK